MIACVALAIIQRDPHDAAAWRALDRWTRKRWPSRGDADREDARQLALMTIWRRANDLRDLHPAAVEAWLWRIWNSRLAEVKRRRPHLPLSREIAAPHPLPARAVDALVADVDRRVAAMVAGKRDADLHRVQARAALLRVVYGLSSVELAPALFVDDVGRDLLAKWVERGRLVVLRTLRRWADGDTEVIEALREVMSDRLASGAPRVRRAA